MRRRELEDIDTPGLVTKLRPGQLTAERLLTSLQRHFGRCNGIWQ